MSNQTPLENQAMGVKKMVKDLFEPNAAIFWTDLLASSTLGWGFFIIACLAESMSWQMWIAMVASAIALYRALAFIHELSHLKSRAIPGFVVAWNFLVGIPLLLPSFTYMGVHAEHHRLATYGTDGDPEYIPFAGKKKIIFFFIVHSFLLPFALFLRFTILSMLGLIYSNFHHFLEIHASSLSMNLHYCRKVSIAEGKKIKLIESLVLGMWAIPIGLTICNMMPWRVFAIWYAVMTCIMVTNCLRTLGAHRYRSDGNSMSLEEQLLDSVDIPGAWWTVLWAPVGLRYHALHHYFPSIPYHNLPIAYQCLHQTLPPNYAYCVAKSFSLWSSLKALWTGKSERKTV